MKKISLQGNIYKKFFQISEKIFENLDKDVALMNMATNYKKIVEITMRSGVAGEDEAYGRAMHYCVLDNIEVISDYLDNSKEIEYLKNTIIGVFEILELNNDKVIFLDVSNGKEYEIIGEGEGSESSLESDFNVGDLIISRLIKLDDGFYNMKTFYFIKQDSLDKKNFDNLKIGYKQIFLGIKDMLDLEERMEELNKATNNIKENEINYLKRIKQILLKPLGKKKLRLVEQKLKKTDQNSFTEVFEIINSVKLENNDLEKLKEYIVAYLNENTGKQGKKSDQERTRRLQIAINSFFEYLKQIGKEIKTDKKMSENEIKEIEKLKIEWFNTINHLFSNKTPLEFVHEIDPEYDILDLRMVQVNPEEQEFYDGYDKFFTEEEKEIYEEALRYSIDLKYEKAKIGYKKLLKEHSGFFRLKGNYLSVFVNSIIDKYGKLKDNNCIKLFTLKQLEEDWIFLSNIDNELKKLDKLKKGYSIKGSNNFGEIKTHFLPLLRHLIFLKTKSLINELIIRDDEKGLLEKIKYIIPDFEIGDFINKVREENTLFLDYEGRIRDGLGYKEDDMYELFPYFWNKYKTKNDFIDDDIEKLYKNIGIRKLKQKGLENFISFVIKNKKQIKSSRSNIIDYFNEIISDGTITYPINILNIIDDKQNKKDFIECMKILEVEDNYLN